MLINDAEIPVRKACLGLGMSKSGYYKRQRQGPSPDLNFTVRNAIQEIALEYPLEIFSRKCIGWELGRNIDAVLAINALKMAISGRKSLGFRELVHHSDQGAQYASQEYVNLLRENGIGISMSRRGNPYDNAFAESFMKTLKAEEVYMKEYRTFDEAHRNIKQFIEEVYNKKRLHSSIGYVPPSEFEAGILTVNHPEVHILNRS